MHAYTVQLECGPGLQTILTISSILTLRLEGESGGSSSTVDGLVFSHLLRGFVADASAVGDIATDMLAGGASGSFGAGPPADVSPSASPGTAASPRMPPFSLKARHFGML